MARIATYAQDPLLEGQDRIIGSDTSNANATVNFSLASLGDFYTRSGLADATRLGYRFTIAGTGAPRTDINQGTGYIDFSSGTDFANVRSVTISSRDLGGYDTGVLENLLLNGRVKLVSTRVTGGNNPVAQGFYDFGVPGNLVVDPIIVATQTIGFNIPLTPITNAQEGSLRLSRSIEEPDIEFILIPLPSNPGGSGTADGNNFVDGINFNAATNILTLERLGLADLTETIPVGSGTVTSIVAGTGLDGGTITTTGTISLATTVEARIALNDAKVGITPAQAGEIAANTLKVGITPAQALAITTNATDINTNAANIGLNTLKRTYPEADQTKLAKYPDPAIDGSDAGVFNVSIDSSGIITFVDDTIPVDATTPEQVEDIVGAMINRGTQSGITVTYIDNGDPGDGSIDFTVDGVVPPVRSFNGTLIVLPSNFQEVGAARTWTLTLPVQTGFTSTITGATSDDADFVVSFTDSTVTVNAANGLAIQNTRIHVAYTYIDTINSTTHMDTSDATIGLIAVPPTPTTFTTHFGRYASGDGITDVPDFPTALEGNAIEIESGRQLTFPQSAMVEDYGIIQIETSDFTTISFQELINGRLEDLEIVASDISTTAVTGFTSYRLVYGGADLVIQINIS